MRAERVGEGMTVPEDRRESVLGEVPRQTHGAGIRVFPLFLSLAAVTVRWKATLQSMSMLSALVPWCVGVVIVIDSDVGSLGHLRFLSNRDKGPKGFLGPDPGFATYQLCDLG